MKRIMIGIAILAILAGAWWLWTEPEEWEIQIAYSNCYVVNRDAHGEQVLRECERELLESGARSFVSKYRTID